MSKYLKMGLVASMILGTSLSAWGVNWNNMFKHPLPVESRSVENGGTLAAIDAYKDGVGVFITGPEIKDNVDNSAFNDNVFVFGDKAKENTQTLSNQMKFGDDVLNQKQIDNQCGELVQQDLNNTTWYLIPNNFYTLV